MTGFGSNSVECKQFTLTVSARSVNHKSLNISYKAPDVLSAMEYPAIKQIRERFSRGRISVSVELSLSGTDTPEIMLDKDTLVSLVEATGKVAESAGVKGVVSIGELLAVPGIITRKKYADIPEEELRAGFHRALDGALNELKICRVREGTTLAPVFINGLKQIRSTVTPMLETQKESVMNRYGKLRLRVAELLSDAAVDENRLMSELALMADRADIAEEHQRILCHIEHSLQLIESEDNALGKRLGFFLQEIHRELNTVGAKVDDADISAGVIEMKHTIASLKEQAANIE